MKYGKEEFGLGQSFLQKPEMKLLSCLQQNFHLFTTLKMEQLLCASCCIQVPDYKTLCSLQ
jgi:hypothetical protein